MANPWDLSDDATPWDYGRDDAALAKRAKGMTHEQKVEAYRTLPKDDPLVGYLARDIARPREGETPEQAQERAYGRLSDNPGKLADYGSAAATYLQGAPFAGEWMDELLAKLGTGNGEATNLRAIREGREPSTSAAEARKSVALIEAIYQSAANDGAKIRL